MERKIIVIVGPTGSGKTGIGVRLAKEFNGEIVSADSRQIFRGLDLGTGKDLAEYDGVKYHMIDVCEPEEEFSMFKWLEGARAAIEDIFSRGKLPIVVGGTGLYVQALIEGFELEPAYSFQHSAVSGKSAVILNDSEESQRLGDPSASKTSPQDDIQKYSREELNHLTIEQLRDILLEIDPEAYEKVDLKNPHRVIRAIERAQEGTKTTKVKPDFEVLQIGLEWPREILYERIDKRVDDRFGQGMLEEIAGHLERGVDPEWLMKLGLEQRIITDFLLCHPELVSGSQNCNGMLKQVQHDESFEVMKQELKWKTHQYARRQLTWLRRFPEIVWGRDYGWVKMVVADYLS